MKYFTMYTDNYEPISSLSYEQKGRLLDAADGLWHDMRECARNYIMDRDGVEPYDYEAADIDLDEDLEEVFG